MIEVHQILSDVQKHLPASDPIRRAAAAAKGFEQERLGIPHLLVAANDCRKLALEAEMGSREDICADAAMWATWALILRDSKPDDSHRALRRAQKAAERIN